MKVGETALENLVSLPLSKAEAAADPAWFDHYCFVGMGDHFIQFDYTPDQDCQLVLPLQVLLLTSKNKYPKIHNLLAFV